MGHQSKRPQSCVLATTEGEKEIVLQVCGDAPRYPKKWSDAGYRGLVAAGGWRDEHQWRGVKTEPITMGDDDMSRDAF